jgi:hypothetical protein
MSHNCKINIIRVQRLALLIYRCRLCKKTQYTYDSVTVVLG